jgi:multiple sugar transport system substrate-binding protein
MFRKFTGIGLILILMFVTFVACSGNNGAENNQPSPAAGKKDNAEPEVKTPERTKLVFWDKSEYVKTYNELNKARIEQFGKENNVDVEYIAIPPGDVKTKMLAAIEAGNPPDLLLADDFVAKQFIANDQLVEVSDILDAIEFREDSLVYAFATAGWYEVPAYHAPNVMYVRKDKLEEHKLQPPHTWEDVRNYARAVNDPKNNFYGVGFQAGTGADANGRIANLINTFGADLVDKDGKVVVNTPQALEGLKFEASFFQEGLTPPGAITGDDAWNNNAYLTGTVGIVFNSSSIQAAMRDGKPELLDKTLVLPWPAGPEKQLGSGGGTAFIMFKGGNTENAKKFIHYFFEPEYYQNLIEQMSGLSIPTVEGYQDTEFWSSEEMKGWYDSTKNIIPLGHPGPADARASQVVSENILAKAVQEIIINKMDPQKALDQIEKEYKRVYEGK